MSVLKVIYDQIQNKYRRACHGNKTTNLGLTLAENNCCMNAIKTNSELSCCKLQNHLRKVKSLIQDKPRTTSATP
jgi:hypothetical protein